jgi:hypothetical protein
MDIRIVATPAAPQSKDPLPDEVFVIDVPLMSIILVGDSSNSVNALLESRIRYMIYAPPREHQSI